MNAVSILKGITLVVVSEMMFALATVFVKLVTSASKIPAIELTLFRFVIGFVVFSFYILSKKMTIIPKKPKYVINRVVFNTAAVIFFFLGVQYSTVSKANMLNMTYPVFVFLVSPFITGEKTNPINYLFLVMTMLGLYFVIIPDLGAFTQNDINIGDIFALVSGILAGFAVSYLRQASKFDEAYIIIFYLMGLGALINLAAALPFLVIPRGVMLAYCILSGVFGVIGQVLITMAYRHIKASTGSVASTSRMLFSIVFGIVLFGDAITVRIVIGGLLIIISLIGVSGFWKNKSATPGMEIS